MRHFKRIDPSTLLSLLFACVLSAIAACAEPSGPAADSLFLPPDLASQNFDSGSVSPYTNLFVNEVDVADDPTNSGRGKVARMHYARVNSLDKNIFLQFSHNIGFDSTIYSRGDFYIDVDDLGVGAWPDNPQSMARKLVYYRPNQPVTKYGGAWRNFLVLVQVLGDGTLWAHTKYELVNGTHPERIAVIATGLRPKTWYTLETQVSFETSIGAGDGIFQVWLDGALVYSITDMKLTDPAWIGIPIPGGNSTPYELADCYLKYVYVGQQVNVSGYAQGTFNEYRYWDNVSFSHTRIGQ